MNNGAGPEGGEHGGSATRGTTSDNQLRPGHGTSAIADTARPPYTAAEILAEFPAVAVNGDAQHEHRRGEETAELVHGIMSGETYHLALLSLSPTDGSMTGWTNCFGPPGFELSKRRALRSL